jgi:signal transduction histidine kinase
MDAAFLAKLTSQAMLGDLQLDDVRVSVDDTAEVVKRLFEECRDLTGVLVVRGAALEGVISRERFLRHMARPFYREVFTRRPLRRLLELLHVEPLRLPQSLSVHEAAHRALQRPGELTDEPLIVELDDGDFRLLSMNVLLLSQSRMLELANETIRRQKDIADAANEAKSRFLANMSHEIRTPMNGILGLTDILLESETNEEKRQYLVMVKNSADSLVAVINDILDFSKIEAGHLGLEETEFRPRDAEVLAPAGKRLRPLDQVWRTGGRTILCEAAFGPCRQKGPVPAPFRERPFRSSELPRPAAPAPENPRRSASVPRGLDDASWGRRTAPDDVSHAV